MLRMFVRCLVCLVVAFSAPPLWAAVEAEDVNLDEEGSAASEEEPEPEATGGLECSPAVSEVESRRPIPVSCAVTRDGVARIEARFRAPGKKKFTRLRLKKDGDEWVGEIPCALTAKTGTFRLSFNARNKAGKVVARIKTVSIQVVESSEEPAPAYPGKDPPMRCYSDAECPAELKGSAACPGTGASESASAARGWGASCGKSSECQSGLACINGTCETPPKCESTADCPSGGECSGGVCSFPDPEELAERLGPPKFNWIGLHFGFDLMLVRDAVGVCGDETADSDHHSCFQGGNPYEGTPNEAYSGEVKAGFRSATMRALASYERWFGRFGAGARIGFAFGGAPKDFSPVHLEARVMYMLRPDPLNKRGRPYLGLAVGMAQADPKSKLKIIDCSDAGPACLTAQDPVEIAAIPGVRELEVDAYRQGSNLFFGPTLGYIYALSNESGIHFNVNVMFPDMVFEPSIGYVMGL